MNTQETISPCIGVCCMNDDGYCVGCYRTINEIREWVEMGHTQRKALLRALNDRELTIFGN